MKKKNLLLFIYFLTGNLLQAQTLRPVQWASSVIAVSSEYHPSPGTYSGVKLLGAPEFYPSCGDDINSWTPLTQNGSREFFVLGFTTPQPVNNIRIYQSLGPGAVDTVYVRNASNGVWTIVYQATAVNQAACPGTELQLLEINFATTPYNVDAVRVAINSPVNTNWNEFDAVSIANFDVLTDNYNQYATSVIGFSSEYNPSPNVYSADKLRGNPDAGTLATGCATNGNSWSPTTADGQREWFMLGYSYPAKVNRVMIYQTANPGGVDTVYLREYGTNTWHQVYQATASAPPFCTPGKYLEINFTKTTYLVDAVRVAINSPTVTGYQEIDAVGIRCELPANAKRSVASGNWSNTATWEGGTLPVATDTVLIGSHTVTLDANAVAASVLVSRPGTLNINSNSTLNIGPFGAGGGNKALDIQGVLTMSNGTINIGGRLVASAGSSFTMTGGTIAVDGNTGTLATSIADNQYLVDFPAGLVTFGFTGGTINIVDPPAGASVNTLRSNYNFGSGSTLRFGNGVSTDAGGSIYGFDIRSLAPAQIGHLTSDALSGTNRTVSIERATTVNGNMTINSGFVQLLGSVTVTGAITNNGSIKITTPARVNGSFTNNGTTSMTGGSLSIGDDFINNAGATYTVTGVRYTSVNDDIVNDGTFSSNWLYFADDFNTASVNAQTIGGTGTFNIYGLEVRNSNAAGVTAQQSLTVQEIFFDQGRLFLGANDLTFSSIAAGYGSPGAGNYVVTNGTGRLRFTNLTTTEILFPIGTATTYNPVRVNNGSGHTFSAGVQNGFTVSPPGTQHVNREWDIDDISGGAVSATVILQWNTADEDVTFNRNACAVAHYNGSDWGSLSPAAVAQNPSAGIYTRSATGVSSFSPFTVSSNSVVLPVTLVYFQAQKNNGKVKINWRTESEVNLSRFVVERSNDGINFTSLKTVAATNTAGLHDYFVIDAIPFKGNNFYRLKMVDIDDKYKFSHIDKVDFEKKITITISPNPSHGEIIIQSDRDITSISIIDMTGKVIRRFSPSTTNRYTINSITPGIYLVRVITDNYTEVQKLVIQ